MFPAAFRRLLLLGLEAHDLALSKLERNSARDREDIRYLARAAPLDLSVLEGRYQSELRPYVANTERQDLTMRLWARAQKDIAELAAAQNINKLVRRLTNRDMLTNMATFNRFKFAGHAVGAAARFHRLDDTSVNEVVPTQGAVVLASTGGKSEAQAVGFRYEVSYPRRRCLLALDRVHTWVEGRDPDGCFETEVDVEVGGFHVLDKLHIDSIQAHHLAVRKSAGDVAAVSTKGSHVKGLRMGNVIAHITFDDEPLTYTGSQEQLVEFYRTRGEQYRKHHGWRFQTTPDGKVLADDHGHYRFSLVSRIELSGPENEKQSIEVTGYTIYWKGFGRIILGEVHVKDQDRRVSLVRLAMGSDAGGSGIVGEEVSSSSSANRDGSAEAPVQVSVELTPLAVRELSDPVRHRVGDATKPRPTVVDETSPKLDWSSGGASSTIPRGAFPSMSPERGVFPIEQRSPERDDVDCTVFAPPAAKVGKTVLIQVFAHVPDQAERAKRTAIEFDQDARRRGVTSLGTKVARGSALSFGLTFSDIAPDEPLQSLIWQGRMTAVQFSVAIPPDAKEGTRTGKVVVSQDSVPIGVVRFKLDIVEECSLADAELRPCGVTVRFHRAFISYAKPDRSEVLRRVQMLAAAGIDYFQDILNLNPGDRWMNEIYRHIEESDVLLLFWSSAAKKSKWVRLEWRYALENKHEDAVLPIVIEGPPIVRPPKELAHLHFNDPFLYFLAKSANKT
jgi:hypothetical protein